MVVVPSLLGLGICRYRRWMPSECDGRVEHNGWARSVIDPLFFGLQQCEDGKTPICVARPVPAQRR
jgi:hypothetical protein